VAGRDRREPGAGPGRRAGAAARGRDEGLLPVLTKAVRDIELAVQRARVRPSTRTTFQAVALLVREERSRVQAAELSEGRRSEALKRIDRLATVLARTAARDSSLLALLTDDAELLSGTSATLRELRLAAGMDVLEQQPVQQPAGPAVPAARTERQVVPRSVISRQLANPFLEPDFSAPLPAAHRPRQLATWELLQPLLRAFENASGGASSCMPLPEPASLRAAFGRELMPHQAQVVAAAAEGHRTFLLADEPGLGKTAQALLAAEAAGAYPLLAVVPNVVKTNWARETGLWTPSRRATVVHGDGDTIDAFSDVVVVNYEVLDRHVGWLGSMGFRGMVVDEAHFIKNKGSQRSRHVLELSRRIRSRTVRPLLMALTGTPLINDIEDFLAIWEFLGWIDDGEPGPALMEALEDNGSTPLEPEFYPAARAAVIELGHRAPPQGRRRRRHPRPPHRRPAGRAGRRARPVDPRGGAGARPPAGQALPERARCARLRRRGRGHRPRAGPQGRRLGAAGRQRAGQRGERLQHDAPDRPGQGRAGGRLRRAAGAQRGQGRLLRQAHRRHGHRRADLRLARPGLLLDPRRPDGQGAAAEHRRLREDPDVAVAVCSLTAAGVGINLQVSSNVVLAELSWTDAEQTQAIDRVHRIGQDQPVTAWRIIAAQTIDARIAELIDSKAGLAARALDGSDEEVSSSVDVQLEALVSLLTEALDELD
jgi:hypothetical protein